MGTNHDTDGLRSLQAGRGQVAVFSHGLPLAAAAFETVFFARRCGSASSRTGRRGHGRSARPCAATNGHLPGNSPDLVRTLD